MVETAMVWHYVDRHLTCKAFCWHVYDYHLVTEHQFHQQILIAAFSREGQKSCFKKGISQNIFVQNFHWLPCASSNLLYAKKA